jgi:hypothetical protein
MSRWQPIQISLLYVAPWEAVSGGGAANGGEGRGDCDGKNREIDVAEHTKERPQHGTKDAQRERHKKKGRTESQKVAKIRGKVSLRGGNAPRVFSTVRRHLARRKNAQERHTSSGESLTSHKNTKNERIKRREQERRTNQGGPPSRPGASRGRPCSLGDGDGIGFDFDLVALHARSDAWNTSPRGNSVLPMGLPARFPWSLTFKK